MTAKVYLNGHSQTGEHGLVRVSCSFLDCPGESDLGDALPLQNFLQNLKKGLCRCLHACLKHWGCVVHCGGHAQRELKEVSHRDGRVEVDKSSGRIALLIEAGKNNDIEPFADLRATLGAIAGGYPQSRIGDLLPSSFRSSR